MEAGARISAAGLTRAGYPAPSAGGGERGGLRGSGEDKQRRRVVETRKDAIFGAEVRVVFRESPFIFWPSPNVPANRRIPHKL
jgi:hypothetical protein